MNLKIGKHLRWEWRTEKVEQVLLFWRKVDID